MSIELAPHLSALFLLGAVHGINPAMGWLFAVALGLQDGGRRAVWRAFLPLALGHALAIAVAVAVAAALGVVLAPDRLRWVVAGALALTGIRQLVRHRHVRWGGMRMGRRDLMVWSFLMASAHGAGLMALPLVLDDAPRSPGGHAGHLVQPAHATAVAPAAHAAHAAVGGSTASPPASASSTSPRLSRGVVLMATVAHALGYMVVTCLVAVIVYERVGLRILRSAWLNVDVAWAVALVLAAAQVVLA
jgi:hypothetical protein